MSARRALLTPRRVAEVLALSAGLLAMLAALAIAVGPGTLSLAEVWGALVGDDATGPAADIVWRVRLPRVLLAMAVGAALSVAGVLFQALLRNPLADPYVLGVSGGAALGAVALLSLGGVWGISAVWVSPAAFVGAMTATALLYVLAGHRGTVSPTSLLLTGVVLNAIASAGIVFLASLADMNRGSSILLWLVGSLSAARADAAPGVALLLVAGLGCALPLARNLNLLALGEESARHLGVAVERDLRILLVATSLMVGAAVSAAGLVGFVGLIVPHLMRLVLGPDHRLLVPSAALAGAGFLLVCDTAARSVGMGRELPVGAITALVGGPLFLVLLRRHTRATETD